MKYVYLIYEFLDDINSLRMVCSNETLATTKVNLIAEQEWKINSDRIPPDYDGSLMRYGWGDAIWWQKEVLYD